METVILVLAIVICVVMLYVLACTIVKDIRCSIEYLHADKVTGTIVNVLDIERKWSYGKYQPRYYRHYIASCNFNTGTVLSDVLLFNKDLKPGDSIKLRYITDEEGYVLLDDFPVRRMVELIVSTIVVIVCIFIVYLLKSTGRF